MRQFKDGDRIIMREDCRENTKPQFWEAVCRGYSTVRGCEHKIRVQRDGASKLSLDLPSKWQLFTEKEKA